jgi:hypothetical protein
MASSELPKLSPELNTDDPSKMTEHIRNYWQRTGEVNEEMCTVLGLRFSLLADYELSCVKDQIPKDPQGAFTRLLEMIAIFNQAAEKKPGIRVQLQQWFVRYVTTFRDYLDQSARAFNVAHFTISVKTPFSLELSWTWDIPDVS